MIPPFYLELRLCAGGCGKTFRCLPQSPARHARGDCRYTCHGEARPSPRDKTPEQRAVANVHRRAGLALIERSLARGDDRP